jgi:cardiolipin synthase
MLWIVIALLVFIFQIATILIMEFRHPSKTIAWLVILFILPIIGFVMYYFLAKEYRQKKKIRDRGGKITKSIREHICTHSRVVEEVHELVNGHMHHQDRLFGLLKNLPDSPITKCNETTILTNASDTYEAIMRELEIADNHIHMEYYTIRSDNIGKQFQRLLIKKALQGVKVRLIYDGVGSYELDKQFLAELKEAGVEFRSFLPPWFALFDKRINYRNHRKIVIVDGKVGFVGGINIGDEYLGHDPRMGFWRDTHIRIKGDAAYYLQHTFLRDWDFVSGERLTEAVRYFPPHDCPWHEQVQIISSGPDTNWDGILEMFFAALTSATRRIYITSPYFIPDTSIAIALKTAALSGVDVRVILPGVADSKFVKWASLSYVDELMQAGVRFYQYKQGFVHAKVMIIDRLFATVGTANMDMRSFFSNFELNAVMFDEKTIDRLEVDFVNDIKHSKEMISSEFEQRSRFQKSMEVFARLLSPLL